VLTQVGIDWFESTYPNYKAQLLKKFSDAPDIELNQSGGSSSERTVLVVPQRLGHDSPVASTTIYVR